MPDVSYEEFIRANAERHGFTVKKETRLSRPRDPNERPKELPGLLVERSLTEEEQGRREGRSTCWHRLGGDAEAAYNGEATF